MPNDAPETIQNSKFIGERLYALPQRFGRTPMAIGPSSLSEDSRARRMTTGR